MIFFGLSGLSARMFCDECHRQGGWPYRSDRDSPDAVAGIKQILLDAFREGGCLHDQCEGDPEEARRRVYDGHVPAVDPGPLTWADAMERVGRAFTEPERQRVVDALTAVYDRSNELLEESVALAECIVKADMDLRGALVWEVVDSGPAALAHSVKGVVDVFELGL